MARLNLSLKHIAIDKASRSIITVITTAVVVLVFTVIGSRQLLMKLSYQNRVISAKKEAKNRLQENIKSTNNLVEAYKTFEAKSPSIIGTTDKNSKIVLDALPSKYDFPALTSSIEKILSLNGYNITGIAGTDDELLQSQSPPAGLIEIPFAVTVESSYANVQKLINDFDRSIRPLHILSIDLEGGDQSMKINLKAKTYYQTEQRLEITTKEIK